MAGGARCLEIVKGMGGWRGAVPRNRQRDGWLEGRGASKSSKGWVAGGAWCLEIVKGMGGWRGAVPRNRQRDGWLEGRGA